MHAMLMDDAAAVDVITADLAVRPRLSYTGGLPRRWRFVRLDVPAISSKRVRASRMFS